MMHKIHVSCVAPLTARRDDRRNTFMVEMRTKNHVSGPRHEGRNSQLNAGCHDPFNKGDSSTTRVISRA